MYLALKEIKHEKIRYSLIIAMVVLISYLVFILTSLALGLARENTYAIESWDFEKIALNRDADVNLRQSLLTKEQINELKLTKNEALIGQAPIIVKEKGRQKLSATFVGLERSQFVYQQLKLSSGHLPKTKQEVVVDDSFKNDGYKLGDKVYFNSQTTPYTITGFIKNAKLNVLPVVYGSLTAWAELKNVGPNFAASGVLSKDPDFKVTDPQLQVATQQALIDKLPGYSAQNSTFTFMIAFLMIISLIVIAVFLYIITIQKLPNYAVLRVQGIANKVLIQNTIGQSFILVVTGLIIGALLTLATALVIPANVPMTFDLKFLSLVSVGLVLTSVLGSLIPVRAILRIDPAQAIGG